METLNFVQVLLSLALIWLPLHGQGYVVSSSSSLGYLTGPVSTSYYASVTSRTSGTNNQYGTPSLTTSTSLDMDSTPTALPDTIVMTMTWLSTITQTSFIPVSTLVTQSGSLIYYSTWLVPVYPVTVTTVVDYITSTITEVPIFTPSTISPPIIPSVVYECLCPAPETETVYVLATIGPAMAITSAILFPWNSVPLSPQTVTETVSVTTTALLPPTNSEAVSATLSSILLGPGPVIIPTKALSSLAVV